MRILHVTTGLNNGGAEAILFGVVTSTPEHEHHVVSLMDGGVYGALLRGRGTPVHELGMPRGRIRLGSLARLRRLIREVRPDVIQTWMYHADLLGGITARAAGLRTVVWGIHHGSLAGGEVSRTTRMMARVCASLSRSIPMRIICCSEAARQEHVRFGYDVKRCVVVVNGIDVDAFRPDDGARDRVRKEIGVPSACVLIGTVARWHPVKGHETLFAAFEQLAATGGWRAVLVGTGMAKENTHLVEALRRRGVMDRVTLLGPRDDVAAVMNALDVHVLPSSSESFGNVTAEAMACGTPAVVTDVGAGRELVGDTGWVVPPNDPAAMAAALRNAVARAADRESSRPQRESARRRIVESFNLDRMTAGYLEVWRAVSLQGR